MGVACLHELLEAAFIRSARRIPQQMFLPAANGVKKENQQESTRRVNTKSRDWGDLQMNTWSIPFEVDIHSIELYYE